MHSSPASCDTTRISRRSWGSTFRLFARPKFEPVAQLFVRFVSCEHCFLDTRPESKPFASSRCWPPSSVQEGGAPY